MEACLYFSPTTNQETGIIIKSTCDVQFGAYEDSHYATPVGACAKSGYYWTVIVNAMAVHGDSQNLGYYVFSSMSHILRKVASIET